jgi:hypothetical protein
MEAYMVMIEKSVDPCLIVSGLLLVYGERDLLDTAPRYCLSDCLGLCAALCDVPFRLKAW